MPNINQRIEPVRKGNVPDLRRGVNETIDTVNWLMGMRTTNGNPISEGGRGPIIDVNTPVILTGSQPWATDPDGNTAGWVKMTMINTQNAQYYDAWVWAGPSSNLRPVPWLTDPSNLPANWVVCADNTFWGTGGCPAGVGNYQEVAFSATGAGSNPYVLTGNATSPPIVPPSSPPAFYLTASSAEDVVSGQPHQPCLVIGVQLFSTDPTINVTFTWTGTYDGTTVFSFSGSGSFNYPNGNFCYLVSPTDWLYDPGGLPGYSHGSKKWIYQYQGAVSANTNPTFVETFSWSIDLAGRTAQPQLWPATLLTK